MELFQVFLIVVGECSGLELAIDQPVGSPIGHLQQVALALGQHHQTVGKTEILKCVQNGIQLGHGLGDVQTGFVQNVLTDPEALIGVVVIGVHTDERGNLPLVVDQILIDVGVGIDDIIVVDGVFVDQGQQIHDDIVLNGLCTAAGVLSGSVLHHVGEITGGTAEHKVVGCGLGADGGNLQLDAGDFCKLFKHGSIGGLGNFRQERGPCLPIGQGGFFLYQRIGHFGAIRRRFGSGIVRGGSFVRRGCRLGGLGGSRLSSLLGLRSGCGSLVRGAGGSAAGKQCRQHGQCCKQGNQFLFHLRNLLLKFFLTTAYEILGFCAILKKHSGASKSKLVYEI